MKHINRTTPHAEPCQSWHVRKSAAAVLCLFLSFTAPATAQPANPTNGKRLFEVKACYECHGWQGQGGLNGPRLAQTKLNLQGFRTILRNPPPSNMPPYRPAVLTDAEVTDLFAFIQSIPPPQPVVNIPLLSN